MKCLIGTVLWAVFLIAGPAQAQQQSCAKRAAILNYLAVNHKEVPVAMGITANGGVLEVITSKDGSWTILVTMPNGLTCGVASGKSWETLAPPEGDLL